MKSFVFYVSRRFDVYDIDDDKAVEYVKDLELDEKNKCGSTEVINRHCTPSTDSRIAGSDL